MTKVSKRTTTRRMDSKNLIINKTQLPRWWKWPIQVRTPLVNLQPCTVALMNRWLSAAMSRRKLSSSRRLKLQLYSLNLKKPCNSWLRRKLRVQARHLQQNVAMLKAKKVTKDYPKLKRNNLRRLINLTFKWARLRQNKLSLNRKYWVSNGSWKIDHVRWVPAKLKSNVVKRINPIRRQSWTEHWKKWRNWSFNWEMPRLKKWARTSRLGVISIRWAMRINVLSVNAMNCSKPSKSRWSSLIS